jgi:tetratricopeptide (TPR) repeat protein
MGKTYLAGALLDRLPTDTAVLRASVPPTGSPPLYPVSEALAGANRFADEIADLAEEYAGALPVLRESLAPLIRVHRKLKRGRALSAEVAPSESYAFTVLLSVFRSLSKRRHVVLFMDDVQWLDPSSIAFLGRLVSEAPALKAFVLLSARTNGNEPATLRQLGEALDRLPPDATCRVDLLPLTPTETGDMAVTLLRGRIQFSQAQLAWLQSTSQGSPLYLAEILTLLLSRGALVQDGAGWALSTEPENLLVPPSYAKATLGRLWDATAGRAIAESAVQYGAVLGRRFDVRLIARLLRTSAAQVRSELSAVSHATGYLECQPPGNVYSFCHDLTREAVLQELGESAAGLHLEVAKLLRALPKSRPHDIARHYRAAGKSEQAGKYYHLAYLWSTERSAFHDAADCAQECDRSLAAAGLSPDSLARVEAIEDLAEGLLGAERYADAAVALQDRLETALLRKRPRMPRLLGRALARLSDDEAHRSAGQWLRTALRFSEEQHDLRQVAETWTDLVSVYDALGEYDRSQSAFRTALRLAHEGGLTRLLVRLLRMTCIFFQPEITRDYLHEALKLTTEHCLRYEQGLCRNNLGTAHLHLREFASAEEQLVLSRRILEKLGGYRSDYPTNNLGVLRLFDGQVQDGRDLLTAALDRCNDADARLFIRSNLGVADALEGNLAEAIGRWREIVPLADGTGDLFYRDCLRHNLAMALTLRGEGQEASMIARACPPHHVANDDVLIRGKRARLLLQAMARGAEEADRTQLEEDVLALATTTKPQAWHYREPWYYCDIEFWED